MPVHCSHATEENERTVDVKMQMFGVIIVTTNGNAAFAQLGSFCQSKNQRWARKKASQ